MTKSRIVDKIENTKHVLNLFDLKNILFFEFSINNNWITLIASEGIRKNTFPMGAFKKAPLSVFTDSIINLNQQEINDLFVNLSHLDLNQSTKFHLQIGPIEESQWLELVTVKVEDDFYLAMVENTTESRFLDQKLEVQSKQEEIIPSNVHEFVIRYNLEGQPIYYNQSFQQMFQINDIDNYNIKTDSEETTWFNECLQEPYYNTDNTFYPHKDLHVKWFNQAIFIDDKIDSIISVGVDITDIMKSHDNLRYELLHDKKSGFLNFRGLKEILDTLQETTFDYYHVFTSGLDEVYKIYGEKTYDLLVERLHKSLATYKQKGIMLARVDQMNYVIINNFDNYTREQFQESLLEMINHFYDVNNFKIFITSDIGLVKYPEDTHSTQLLRTYGEITVEQASYLKQAKILNFSWDFFLKSFNDLEILTELVNAMNQQTVQIVFQEIINHHDHTVAYIETLCRWDHPTRGTIPPTQIFELAEQSYIGRDLDFLIINKSLQQFSNLIKLKKYKDTILTINITPKTLIHHTFIIDLVTLIREHHLNPSQVCIEISENTFIHDEVDFKKIVSNLRSHNVLIAIDDFGQKYSSLGIINEVDFNIIKVDKMFTDTLQQKSTITILKMMRKLSKILKRTVIIEGVETETQLNQLIRLGFKYFQGYYFSKPTTLDELKNLSEN